MEKNEEKLFVSTETLPRASERDTERFLNFWSWLQRVDLEDTLSRFIKFALLGMLVFLFNLGCIFIFRKFFGTHYFVAVPLAFLIGGVMHYLIAWLLIFPDSKESAERSFVYFIAIGIAEVFAITGGVIAMVEFAHINLYIARTIMAAFSGVTSFYLNARFSFNIWK